MTAIADTSYVVAVAVASDIRHNVCLRTHAAETRIYLPQSTLAEVGYLLTRFAGNRMVSEFILSIVRGETKYVLIPIELSDLERTAAILDQYADSRVDFVDATIIAVAERLRVKRILTLDRRDFSLVKPAPFDAFDLLPALD